MGSRLEILWREVIEHVPRHLRCRGGNEPFGRFVDESQKRIPLRLLDIAVEKVDPAFVHGKRGPVRNHRGRHQRLIRAESRLP